MAFKYREDIVGKRFLSVRSSTKLKVSKIAEWEWRSGVVRAVSSRDVTNKDISVSIGLFLNEMYNGNNFRWLFMSFADVV